MLFNSVTFIGFFIIILLVHYSKIPWKAKKINLLLGSYIFYAAWNPPFILLLLFSTLVDWKLAKLIGISKDGIKRKCWLWISLISNLGLLSIFKYSGFFSENFNFLMHTLQIDFKITDPGLILPMGISFYTFQTLSYTLDIYFKRLKPHHSFLDYALFVSFFPQLVAGPIVRAKTFLPQLAQQNKISFTIFSLGISLFIIGIFEKTVLADSFFAPLVNQIFQTDGHIDSLSAWLGSLLFYGQIFSDFAGYSLCAIGTALCLGFTLPFNFKSPFASIGFSDFWKRWHISLSSWLRDYLYIPLGGNRYGTFKTFRNLMITMLLGGLWHGSSWTFVIWGMVHGIFLITEHGIKSLNIPNNKFYQLITLFITFILVMFAFVLFRAESLHQAILIFTSMFSSSTELSVIKWNLWTKIVLLSFILLFVVQLIYKNRNITDVLNNYSSTNRALILSVCLILIAISSGNSNAFIYFQF